MNEITIYIVSDTFNDWEKKVYSLIEWFGYYFKKEIINIFYHRLFHKIAFSIVLENYIQKINNIDDSVKPFIIRQLKRMPHHYYLAVYILCFGFYFLNVQPSKFALLEKLIYSLSIIKSFEN